MQDDVSKVYLVVRYGWEESEVCCVKSKEESAQDYINQFPDEDKAYYGIEEWDIEE